MLNELLREQLRRHLKLPTVQRAELQNTVLRSEADSKEPVDIYEHAEPYKRWAMGVRTLLRLRYLALKKRLLLQYRQELDYKVTVSEIHMGVFDQVRESASAKSNWLLLLGRATVYISLTALLVLLAAVVFRSIANAKEQAVFKQTVPEFSDRVYQLKAQQVRDNTASDEIKALQASVDALQSTLRTEFAGLPGIEAALLQVLDGVERNDVDAQNMISRAKRFNDLLFDRGIAYYISPVSETAYCQDLPIERFFSRLFGGEPSSGALCNVHALTVFDLEESRYYADDKTAHLALFTRRLDEQELNDSFLGLVHIGDDRAQVRLSNIQNASADSLTAISDGALKSKLLPKGMPDVYGLESLARRLQSRVINGYVDDIRRRWWARIPSLWQELRGQKPDLLALAGVHLQNRMADVTAFHEVQHLVDQSAQFSEPAWYTRAIKSFGSVVQNDTMREHVLWELSAFFTHLAYSKELQGILLNDFASITLNPMLQDQPHYYSIRLLLPILHSQLKGELTQDVVAAKTLADVARAYKALATQSENLGSLAREAYQTLFARPLPALHEIRVPPRSTSRTAGLPSEDAVGGDEGVSVEEPAELSNGNG